MLHPGWPDIISTPLSSRHKFSELQTPLRGDLCSIDFRLFCKMLRHFGKDQLRSLTGHLASSASLPDVDRETMSDRWPN
jgi:hypothetical protein